MEQLPLGCKPRKPPFHMRLAESSERCILAREKLDCRPLQTELCSGHVVHPSNKSGLVPSDCCRGVPKQSLVMWTGSSASSALAGRAETPYSDMS